MRNSKGKLIAVWNPFFHREGGSTIASLLGCALSLYGNKRTLIIDAANRYSNMEKSLEKDIKVKYTLDSLAPIGKDITLEDIQIYATPINDKLSLLAGTRITNYDMKLFMDVLMKEVVKGYDYIFLDIDSGLNEYTQSVLDKADMIISCINLDAIDYLKHDKDILKYVELEKTVCVCNKVPLEAIKEVKTYIEQELPLLKNVVTLPFNQDIFYASIEKNIYTYIYQNIFKNKNELIATIQDIVFIILKTFEEELNEFDLIRKKNWISKLMDKIS